MAFGKLFIISGPSGSGKTTLVEKLLSECGTLCHLRRTVTYTTRPAREGEVDGQDYYFISIPEFKQRIAEHFFIEWSTWYDHFYGSPVSVLQRVQEGGFYFIILDQAGAHDVVRTFAQAVLIWIAPPSVAELERRLIARGDNETTIKARLGKAAVEMEQEHSEHFYKYHIINDNFDVALQELRTIIEKELGRSLSA